MFSYSNSWFNLIVFAYFREDLRRGFAHLLKTSCLRRMRPSVWSHDSLSETGSKAPGQEEVEKKGEEEAATAGQDNTLIMMEF